MMRIGLVGVFGGLGFEELCRGGDLFIGRRPAVCEDERAVQSFGIAGRFLIKTVREAAGSRDREVGVELVQRLERHRRTRPPRAVEDDAGSIEDLQQTVNLSSLLLEIDRAALRAGMVFGHDGLADSRARGGDVRTEQTVVEVSAGKEHRVTNGLGIQSAHGEPGQPPRIWIKLQAGFVRQAALFIGGRVTPSFGTWSYFRVGRRFGAGRGGRSTALCLASLASVAMMVFAQLQFLASNGKFFWVFDHPFMSTYTYPLGCFTNRNHLAQFLTLGTAPLIWW